MKKSETKHIDKLYKQAVVNFSDTVTVVSNEHELLILNILPEHRCPKILLITDEESKIPHETFSELLSVGAYLTDYDPDEITCIDTDPDSYKIQAIYDVKYNWFRDIYKEYLAYILDVNIYNRWINKIENELTYGLTIEIASYLS